MPDCTAHELALIAEYCGGDALLRKILAEYRDGVAEWVEQEKAPK